MSLILRIQRLKITVGVYDVLVSILNLETRNSISAASLVQRWVRTCCSSCVISSEDQVCSDTEYDLMFWDIALAVLSGLGGLGRC